MRLRAELRVEMDPVKLVPLLVGPGGAIAALLLFIGYLIRELSTARRDRDKFMGKYEDMREQRDEFRFIAGDAVRAGKRAVQTGVVLSRHRSQLDEDTDV